MSSAGRPGGWPSIHAGVAAGLAGDTDAAHRMFASFDRRSDAVQGITYITVTHNRTLDGTPSLADAERHEKVVPYPAIDEPDWLIKAKAVSTHLDSLADEPKVFRTAILDLINQNRSRHKLPLNPACLP